MSVLSEVSINVIFPPFKMTEYDKLLWGIYFQRLCYYQNEDISLGLFLFFVNRAMFLFLQNQLLMTSNLENNQYDVYTSQTRCVIVNLSHQYQRQNYLK